MTDNPQALATQIPWALVVGETHESIARRLNTSLRAVEVVAKGMKGGAVRGPLRISPVPRRMPTAQRPLRAAYCPWRGHFVSMDGTNVSGWSRRRGEPRLAQTLAICRWFSTNGIRFSCWFDSNFRRCLMKYAPKDAAVLEAILREEPNLFKQAPAGRNSMGEPIKADPYVIRDADSFPGGLILTGDLFRREAKEAPAVFGWTQTHPERRITGQIAANGDVLLGDNGEIRIPVNDDSEFYIH